MAMFMYLVRKSDVLNTVSHYVLSSRFSAHRFPRHASFE